MKKLLMSMLVATALVPIFTSGAKAETREDISIAWTAQAVSSTQSINISPWKSLSAQAVYSDGTPALFTSSSGAKASATITVGANPTGLIGVQASITINIKSTTTITGKSVTLNGTVFTAGTDFTVGATTAATATNLKAKIDAHPDWVATVSVATVTVKYVTYGTAGNGLPAVTSSAANYGLSAATFSGGVNRPVFTINGITFTEGIDWNANSSSQTTAINISTSVNAVMGIGSSVPQISASTTSLGVVTLTATEVGFSNYNLSSSTSGLVTSGGFPGGLASDVVLATDIFTRTNHRLTTGMQVLAVAIVGTVPTGLTTGTTYFAIKLNENQFKLATTANNAIAGTAIDITGITNNATMELRPLALVTAAGNGFFWQVSNDNANYTNLTGVTVNGVSVSSVTYSAAGNSVWDFGAMNYKFLRANFTAPTSGGIALTVRIVGKRD